MNPWPRAWNDGLEAGAAASVLSAAVLAVASKAEAGSPFACLNATSHWIWGDRAARRAIVAGYLSFRLRLALAGMARQECEAARRRAGPPAASYDRASRP